MKKSLEKFFKLVDVLESLPSIGKKSATKLAFHLVLDKPMDALKIAHTIEEAVSSIRECAQCGGLSEDELCYICSDELRDQTRLCLVESAKDIYIVEESGEYRGLYMVFERLSETNLQKLKNLIIDKGIEEVIFAFTPSIQNDAVILYIEEWLKEFELIFTKIAQGVPTGVSLENIDTLSLAKAMSDRVRV